MKASGWVAVAFWSAMAGMVVTTGGMGYAINRAQRVERAATAVVQAWDNTTPSCANGAEMAVLEEAVVKLDAAVSR
jgi:hypothetical protein